MAAARSSSIICCAACRISLFRVKTIKKRQKKFGSFTKNEMHDSSPVVQLSFILFLSPLKIVYLVEYDVTWSRFVLYCHYACVPTLQIYYLSYMWSHSFSTLSLSQLTLFFYSTSNQLLSLLVWLKKSTLSDFSLLTLLNRWFQLQNENYRPKVLSLLLSRCRLGNTYVRVVRWALYKLKYFKNLKWGAFFHMKSPALRVDIVPASTNKTDVWTAYEGNAYNCFITAGIYVLVLVFSAWQSVVNAKLAWTERNKKRLIYFKCLTNSSSHKNTDKYIPSCPCFIPMRLLCFLYSQKSVFAHWHVYTNG